MTGITESKQKNGTLTIGDMDFAVQATNVTISRSYKDDGEPVEVLSGAALGAGKKRSESLKITSIEDFTNPAGVQDYLETHDQDVVEFSWQPAGIKGPKWEGNLQVLCADVGDGINTRTSAKFEFPIEGKSKYTPAAKPAELDGENDGVAIDDTY